MSYLGNNPNKGSFFQQKFTGDGSTTAFTLLQSVTDGSQLIITIGNVIQEEGSGKAYTASGTTLTFDSAPANNDAIVVRYLGRSLDTPTTYATQITFKYVATNAQTAFSGSDANGNTLSYTIGSVDVYLNGVHLDTTDFTETNESTITLASGATTNDELVIVAKRTITLTDVVPKSAGGTFAGDVIAGGALTVNGAFTSQGIDDNADATAITITSAERVGIGTTSPATAFHVQTSTDGTGLSGDDIYVARFQNQEATTDKSFGVDIQAGSSATDQALRIKDHDGTNSLMLVDGLGNMAIGQTDVRAKLSIGKAKSGTSAESVDLLSLEPTGTFAIGDRANINFHRGSTLQAQISGYYGDDNVAYGELVFSTRRFTTDALNEGFRLDNRGRVGIGTSSPAHLLEVDGGSAETRLRVSTTGTDANEAGIILANSSKSAFNDGIEISHGGGFTSFKGLTGTEHIRLQGNGNLGIGTTDNQARIKIFGHLQSYNALMIQNGTNNTGGLFIAFRKFDNVTIGSVSHSGSGSSVAFNTTSDYRLKENVSYDFDATSRLKQLKPARFNWIADEDNTTVDGFLAHEVSDIVPEAITGTKDDTQNIGTVKDKDGNVIDTNISEAQFAEGKKETVDSDGNKKESLYPLTHTWEKTGSENVYQQIDQAKLVPLLVKTIQELEARITTLEGK